MMANIIILTKIASKVAVGKKYRSRTMVTHQWRLLPKVGIIAGHHRFVSGAAIPGACGCAVHPALAGAQRAIQQAGPGLFDFMTQVAKLMGFSVSWGE
jgi:hypothetical protein